MFVHSGGTKTVPIAGGSKVAVVDLSTYDGITELEVTNITDSYGLSYGDLSFDFPE